MTAENGLQTDVVPTCTDCGHAAAQHYALGHVGCHDLRCDCTWVSPTDDVGPREELASLLAVTRRLDVCGALYAGPEVGRDWLLSLAQTVIDSSWLADQLAAARADERERVGSEVIARRTDWGVRDDTTGNVGSVLAYNRRATEEWLAELEAPSTLMRRERVVYADRVTEWVEVDDKPCKPPAQRVEGDRRG